MPVPRPSTTRAFENLTQLVKRGFSIEIGHWPDTPVEKEDEFLGMDALGRVLIARAPLKVEE